MIKICHPSQISLSIAMPAILQLAWNACRIISIAGRPTVNFAINDYWKHFAPASISSDVNDIAGLPSTLLYCRFGIEIWLNLDFTLGLFSTAAKESFSALIPPDSWGSGDLGSIRTITDERMSVIIIKIHRPIQNHRRSCFPPNRLSRPSLRCVASWSSLYQKSRKNSLSSEKWSMVKVQVI